MADPITDPKQAGERLLQFVREGRLVQGVWHGEEGGREIACHLGAAAGVSSPDQCPASLLPGWLAHALPSLFDGQTPAHAQTFARRWGEAMVRPEWTNIDWYAVRGEWLAFIVKQAKDAADANVSGHASLAAAAALYAAADAVAVAVTNIYYAPRYVADAASCAADAAARVAFYPASSFIARTASYEAARNAQADALVGAIEQAMEKARRG